MDHSCSRPGHLVHSDRETDYAGAQDNGTSGGNSQIINNWVKINGGDGFQMASIR